MAIPTEKAYEILNLPLGASKDAIEQSYKKLAVKWHPEKYTSSKKTQEALKRFKLVNLAYRKLIHNNERNEKDITLHEMFEQYRQVFHSDMSKKNKLLAGQTFLDVKNSTQDPTYIKNNTLLELNANNNYSSSVSGHGLLQQYGGAKIVNKPMSNNTENSENQYVSSRENEPVDSVSIRSKVKALAVKGNELAKQGEYLKAIEKFTEATIYDVNDPRIFSNRSFCFDKINCFQEALMDAERAISLEPCWPKGYFRKGRALSGLKLYKEAEEAYEKVFEIGNISDPELEEELFKMRSMQLQEMGFSKAQSENAVQNHGTVQAALEAMLSYSEEERSNESCSDMDNNELDYNGNDSENGEDHLSLLLSKKLNPPNTPKNQQLTKSSVVSRVSKVSTNPSLSPVDSSLWGDKPTGSPATTDPSPYLTCLMSNPQPHTQAHTPSSSTSLSSKSSSLHNSNSSITAGGNGPNLTSLWVGNVDSEVTEEVLIEMFSAYGQLTNVRCLPDKYCAFINFKTKEEAGKAMNALQGKYLEGQRLLIKYPDNPNSHIINNIVKNGNKISTIEKKTEFQKVVKKQATATSMTPAGKQSPPQDQQHDQKPSGPVNGNECYFWRTTGCLYADKCRYAHIKKNKGIDKKPWHK